MKYNKAYYHNEIELIKVNNTDLKNKIEKTFLDQKKKSCLAVRVCGIL